MQYAGDRVPLISAVLEDQRAIVADDSRGGFGDIPYRIQAIGAGAERVAGLVAELIERRIIVFHIGRVRYDEVEYLIGDGFYPVTLQEMNIDQRVLRRVLSCHIQCLSARVGRDNLAFRALAGERNRDGAAACTEIQYPASAAPGNQTQCLLDERLGLGPRHERVGGDPQPQGPELSRASDIGDRLTIVTAREGVRKPARGFFAQIAPRVCKQMASRHAEDPGEQCLGIECGTLADHGKLLRCIGQCVFDCGCRHAVQVV